MRINDLFKKNKITILLLCFFIFLLIKFTSTKVQYSNTLGNTRLTSLVFNKDSIIYIEKIFRKSEYNFSFFLKNTGKNRLYISSLNASCGCTKILTNKNKAEVGDSIKVEGMGIINPEGKSGKNLTIIKFNANTEQKKHTVRLIYNVI